MTTETTATTSPTPDIPIAASPPVTDTSPPSPPPSPPSTETVPVATSLYQCECGQRYNLTEDKRTQIINQGETNETSVPFNSCGCSRHADGMFLVEEPAEEKPEIEELVTEEKTESTNT